MTAYPENKGFSRWSFAPEYGYNQFDGDIKAVGIQPVPASAQQITYGATLEYALSPIWGLALDYFFLPLNAKNNSNTIRINTDLYTSGLNLTANLTRMLFPQTTSKIYFNGGIGLGYSYYSFNSALPSLGTNLKNGQAYSIPFTLSLEYNLSKAFSLGSKVQYIAFNKDDLEGVSSLNFKGNSNDFAGVGTVFLRYKFNSTKKNHLRNVKQNLYYPNEGLELAKINNEKINKLDLVITKLEGIVNYQNSLLDSMSVLLANDPNVAGNKNNHEIKAVKSNISQNRLSDSNGKLLKINIDTSSIKEYSDAVPAVYFNSNQIELDDKALEAISKIAIKMKADPSISAEIRAYSNNVNNDANSLLSQRRSDRVKAELVNYWKIPEKRIISNSKRLVNEPGLKSNLSSRCDIFFVKL